MAVLLTCQSIGKVFGASTLFANVSLTINDQERHGLIGPNGAGKTTLLKVLAGLDSADSGEVAVRKGVRLSYLPQEPEFDDSWSVAEVLERAAFEPSLVPSALGQAGFSDERVRVNELSGGYRKRLAIARALVGKPDLLLLDEPTNHLDLEGITWLERLLGQAPFTSVIISHDRYFLENVATHMMELNRIYPDGLFRVAGAYSEFLEKREAYFEAREKEREALAAKVRREVEWLRRGAKARTRKAKARIDQATEWIASLEDMEARRRTEKVVIDFTSTDRRTKRLLTLEGLQYSIAGQRIVQGLELVLSPGHRLGIAGRNGSGKTTMLRLLLGELSPTAGLIRRADNLRTVYFEQQRQQIDPALPLKRALAPEGDSVIYRGRPIHVNGWARRFLFSEEQLMQPVGSLSGGERARVDIARLMIEPADLLLLDEPTNDLDIPTLEILEESLLEFPGALVLVTHDRFLMDRVANGVLGLDGEGGSTLYADLAQWEAAQAARSRISGAKDRPEPRPDARPAQDQPKRLSYMEQREWDQMESLILDAEEELEIARAELQAPDTVTDPRKLEACYKRLTEAQAQVDRLYARWAELEEKLK